METFDIRHLTFTYPEQEKAALLDVSLKIKKGAFFVLCGHSGSGKSTLLRQLKPAISPHGELSGAILYEGQNLDELSSEDCAARIGFVMQSPENQTVTDKVWHELAFGLESLGFDNETIRRRCAEMAAFFGIENWYYKDVCDLSGGQKQLLCLASIMTMQPDVLILDEPTSQLDPIAASEFLGTLYKINSEFGTTIILSEHRLEEALSYASECAVMDQGTILCYGTVEEVGKILKEQKSPMFSAMPCAMRIWSTVDTEYPCPVTINDGREFLQNYTLENKIHPLVIESEERICGDVTISAKEVWFRYEKNSPDVIKGLDLSISSGEIFCILGGNGSGKTTTIKLLSSILKPYRGEIRVHGTIGMLPQNPQTVFVKKTVYEDLADLLKAKKFTQKLIDHEIEQVANLCHITELLNRHPFDLSGGEQQRAALAKILLLSPDILLLDEPTKGLDMPFKDTLAEILLKLKNSGVTIIMVTHDVEFSAKYADHCGMFFDGRISSISNPRDFFASNNFYTTAANRMARNIDPNVIVSDDVIKLIGGETEEPIKTSEKAPRFVRETEAEIEAHKLPLWRKIGAGVTGLLSLLLFFYTAKNENLSEFIGKGGMTKLGQDQLLLYGIFIVLLTLTALLIGKRSAPSIHIQTPTEKRKLSKRTIVATALILLFIPLTLFVGVVYIDKKQYYITALAILFECMLPFFLIFEGRKPKARELVVISTLCALAIAGRAAFFMLPQFKPVLALTIIAGVALGGETGFLVGAVTMLVSNILFSQGPWTPFQMFAMGIIGFLAGVLYKKGLLMRSRTSLCIFGAICTFIIYGGIMNPASALIWGSEALNFKVLLGYYVTGFPMDAVHAAATVLFLWFGAEPMLEKLDRVKTKYGLIE